MSRDVPFKDDAVCDTCGAIGAFDFMGDYYCAKCTPMTNDAPPAETAERLAEIRANKDFISASWQAVARVGKYEAVQAVRDLLAALDARDQEIARLKIAVQGTPLPIAPEIVADIEVENVELRAKLLAAEARLAQANEAKDGAYTERNRLVAYLARQFPSGIKPTTIEGWDADWHGCVYIDTPTGQMSWHYHDSQAAMFDSLPPYQGEWDGHATEQKYQRLELLSVTRPTQRAQSAGGEVEFTLSRLEQSDCWGHQLDGVWYASSAPHDAAALIRKQASALAGARRAAMEEAALHVAGASVAVNHLPDLKTPNDLAAYLTKRDLALAETIRALTQTPSQ